MLAYQVWECTRSAPSTLAAIAMSVDRMCSAGFASGNRPSCSAKAIAPVALGAHAEDVEVDELAQMAGQEVDVDPGTAVDVGRVLAGEQSYAHATT